jgi:hypothetical protein
MVSGSFIGGLAARAIFIMSTRPSANKDKADYMAENLEAVVALQEWYDRGTGLWNTTGWWNGANVSQIVTHLLQRKRREVEAYRMRPFHCEGRPKASCLAKVLLGC